MILDILLNYFYQPLNLKSMKRIFVCTLMVVSTIILSGSSLINENQKNVQSGIENQELSELIEENISAMGGSTGIVPHGLNPDDVLDYNNARNEYCREPEGATGCVRAVGRKCNLGIFCILPKSNLSN